MEDAIARRLGRRYLRSCFCGGAYREQGVARLWTGVIFYQAYAIEVVGVLAGRINGRAIGSGLVFGKIVAIVGCRDMMNFSRQRFIVLGSAARR